MAKAFSIEDGNLSNRAIVTSVSKLHSDIDCTFEAKYADNENKKGDIYKKTDAASVRQAVKNLLMTVPGEKPFNPYFGSALNGMLFSLSNDVDEDDIESAIFQAIDAYEPRVIVNRVNVDINEDNYSVEATVIFQLINTLETVSVTVSISRKR